MREQIKENPMGTAKMFPLILKFGLPAMFSMMVQALYNIVDSYFVSSYSTDALSAVSLAMPIQNLIIAFSVGTSIGIGSLISRKLGEQDRETASRTATHGLVLSILTWLLFLVFGIFGCTAFFEMFEKDQTIINLGVEYLSIVSSVSIFCFIQICFEKILQSTGNMYLPMFMQLIGAVTNIILDPVLIFGYFGLPELGVAGAAIATIIGQFAAAVFATFVMFNKKHKHEVEIHLKGFKFDKQIVSQIYIVGFPSIVMNAIGTVMLMGINAILASFSAAAYTVFGLYFKLQSFVLMPVFGLTSGLMPIMGYNYGAKNKKRLLESLKIGCIIAFVINVCGTIAFVMLPTELLMMFKPTQEILDIGIPALQIMSLVFPTAAFSITLGTLFQAVGLGVYSLINSVLRQLVVILPLAYIFSKIDLVLVWYAFPLSELVAILVSIVLFIRLYKMKIKNL